MDIDPKKFARKPKVEVPEDIASEMHVMIPPVWYWEDVEGGKSVLMTMAFEILGRQFGMSFPIEDTNVVKIDILRKKLFNIVKEQLDVLVHHGAKVLDERGEVDPRKVQEQEALRYQYDPWWLQKVAAFNELVRIAPITKAKAIKMGLIN